MSTTTPIMLPAAHSAIEYDGTTLYDLLMDRIEAHHPDNWQFPNGNVFSPVELNALLDLKAEMTSLSNRMNDPEKSKGLANATLVQAVYDDYIAANPGENV